MSSKVDWGFKLSVWAHMERTAQNKWHGKSGIGAFLKHASVCILLDYMCLQKCLNLVESSLYLIEVFQVNVLNLVCTSSLWLCDAESSSRLSCLLRLEWLHPGVDKAWNGGRSGAVAKGLFPLRKSHMDFHSEANSVTSPLCHSFAVYFAPLIPWADWHEKSIAWKWMELGLGIIHCKVLSPSFLNGTLWNHMNTVWINNFVKIANRKI